MANERVMASVTLKSRSGLSVFKDFRKFTFSRLDDFRPKANQVDQVVNLLTQAGFTIEAQTDVGVSFSGPKDLLQSEFGVTIRRKKMLLREPGVRQRELSFYEASQPQFMSRRIELIAEAVQLAIPGIPFHNANPPAPNPPYYFLNVLNDVPARLNAAPVHAAGITGTGVRVSMVDTGFVTRITETHVSTNVTHVTVDHTVRHVKGVWLATDPGHTGTNYFTGGNFAGNTITLGTPLPGAATNVQVVYSCLHPHYLAQNYNIDDIRAVGGLDVNLDGYGHGTAEAANALAVAPGCTFSFVKYGEYDQNGNYNSYPLAGFQAAVQHQNPDIITCSWGTGTIDNALLLEIGNAVANGIVVIFSAGNGHTDDPNDVWNAKTVTHPNLISAGGAYPIQGGGFRASNYSSSYDSFIYTNPQRHCPDVVGLVGETPRACLIMLPTEPNNDMDQDLASSGAFPNGDNTATNDGWCVCSGTSAAAPQTAGIVALLLQQHNTLTPMAVKNVLENSARDIQTGSSNSAGPDSAAPGWDSATGFGLIDGQAAVNYLQNAFSPYIRDSVEDNGTEPVVADRLWASPDIIVRSEQVDAPQDELGQTVKHRYDLCDSVEDGQDNYIYLRVQNRGALAGNCTATVYFTDPGMFSNPAAWTNIGQLNIQNLAPGEFRVVGPLTWPDAQVPASGHYCLISILDSPGDPAPDLTAIQSSDDFVNMVRNSNNVAWRNIDVEDVIPGGASSWSFYMEGPQGTGHQADLQINLNNFPAAATVLVKVVKRLADTATLDHMTVAEQSQIYTTLRHLGGIGELESMDLKSNEKTKVTIYYSIPANTPTGAYSIVATLRIDGNNVNSYTKIVNVSLFAYIGNRRSLEIHKRECPWVAKMSPYNKLPLADLDQARKRGFDNCATCIGGSLR
jgi:hypothetical protein